MGGIRLACSTIRQAGYYTYDVKPMANLPQGATGRGSYMVASRKEGAIWQLTYVHLAEDPIKVNK